MVDLPFVHQVSTVWLELLRSFQILPAAWLRRLQFCDCDHFGMVIGDPFLRKNRDLQLGDRKIIWNYLVGGGFNIFNVHLENWGKEQI